MFAELWGSLRGSFSQLLDAIAGPTRRASLPQFNTPEQVADYLLSHCIYRADRIDHSIHPERLQWLIQTQQWGYQSVDCDDWACYAYAALRHMGYSPLLITLAGAGINEAHMICAYYRSLGGDRLECGAIDVNGHHVLPSISQRDIKNHFNGIYKSQNVSFTRAFSRPFPF